jgi:hypothetical protein
MSIGSYEGIICGVKILFSVTDLGRNWHLNIQVYWGSSNDPRVGPEGI